MFAYCSRVKGDGIMSEWIKVEDELPKLDTFVLCCAEGKYQGLSIEVLKRLQYYPNADGKPENYWEFTTESDLNDSYWRVTHWMPLPELPE